MRLSVGLVCYRLVLLSACQLPEKKKIQEQTQRVKVSFLGFPALPLRGRKSITGPLVLPLALEVGETSLGQ